MKISISQEKKEKIFSILSQPYIVILVMLFAPLLNYFDRNFSYFFGLGIALLILWSSGKQWSLFGFTKKISIRTVIYALILTVTVLIITIPFDIMIEHYYGKADLSSLEDIKHNTVGYIVIMLVMWVFAAFGEELLFRGYYMKWLAEFFGNSNQAWIVSLIIVSCYFGLSHYYQGISGILSIIFLTLINSFIFFKNRDNLGLLILMHGFHDTIGLTLLYLDKLYIITEYFEYFFMNGL